MLGDNPASHQKYLQDKLNPNKISINSGHRILSALLSMGKAKVIFTTNFDSVLENAYAFMTGQDLHAFSLEGTYAALNALNNEEFPIYAKMHGDFRYFEMKNLPEQLLNNDKEIEKCFINSCSRYGLVVTGYSGRDKNVMAAFEQAIQQNNAFPKGLFWVTSLNGFVFPSVTKLITDARTKGINAHLIQAETFDTLLSSIWKLTPNKSQVLEQKVRRGLYEIPKIAKYAGNSGYPIIRTNAFPVLQLPQKCQSIELINPLSVKDYVEKIKQAKSKAITVKEKSILAWGEDTEIEKILPATGIKKNEEIDLTDYIGAFTSNTHINSFFNRAMAWGIVRNKPLILRKRFQKYNAVISSKHEKFAEVEGILKEALKTYNYDSKKWEPARTLAGIVPNVADAYWMECVEVSLESYDGSFWLVIRPDIWIEPETKRKDARDFLTAKKRNRYNSTQNLLIEAWKKILLGNENTAVIQPYNDEVNNNPKFIIQTITAFSSRQ